MDHIRSTQPDERILNSVAKRYSVLNYHVQLSSLLEQIYPASSFNNFSKHELHRLLNDALIRHYQGEEILKYRLAKRYFEKRDIIGAYEMNVNSSRVDFLVINGHTTSFEIKSGLDNLSKLEKQMHDYSAVFDYNCLIVDEKHFEKAKRLVPDEWGLWCYVDKDYEIYKKPTKNDRIKPKAQLALLSKTEMSTFFGEETANVNSILKKLCSQEINSLFRKVLKARYRVRWNFLTSHKSQIMPVDYQFFFSNNIQPENIYCP